MKKQTIFRQQTILIVVILLAMALVLAACGDTGQPEDNGDDAVVIEPGVNGDGDDTDPNGEDEPEDPDAPVSFVDKGEDTTIDDLVANRAKISSYYFEQTIPYPDGEIFICTWYCDGQMKVIGSIDGYMVSEDYYDYTTMQHVSRHPSDNSAQQYSFDPSGDNAPVNPKYDLYETYTYIGTETIDRQLCVVLETPIGDKLWVGTKYGFPLQVEYADSLGERYTVQYRNIMINTITADQTAVPADVTIN